MTRMSPYQARPAVPIPFPLFLGRLDSKQDDETVARRDTPLAALKTEADPASATKGTLRNRTGRRPTLAPDLGVTPRGAVSLPSTPCAIATAAAAAPRSSTRANPPSASSSPCCGFCLPRCRGTAFFGKRSLGTKCESAHARGFIEPNVLSAAFMLSRGEARSLVMQGAAVVGEVAVSIRMAFEGTHLRGLHLVFSPRGGLTSDSGPEKRVRALLFSTWAELPVPLHSRPLARVCSAVKWCTTRYTDH